MKAPSVFPSTSAARVLEIDGMVGDACVTRISGALSGVRGVKGSVVKVGSATFGADDSAYNAARAAIGVAGYKSRAGVPAKDGAVEQGEGLAAKAAAGPA